MRRSLAGLLKARPKTAKTEPGSNRYLEEPYFSKAKEIFASTPFPNKRVIHNWRFFVRAGKAATGPPVGQEFSKLGLKVMDFTKAFNDRTKPVFKDDIDVQVRIQVYFDKTYSYRIEPPPTAWFIMRAVRKKRRECAPVHIRNSWTCYMTLEMIYEIAKMKQFIWDAPEQVPIELRVRSILGQARRMGICVLGVDAPSSPVRGMTAEEYAAQSEKYRAIHKEQFEALRQKQLEEAPLIERLHRPNLDKLPQAALEKGMVDGDLFRAVWKASHPQNPYLKDLKDREMALKVVRSQHWRKDMSLEEAQKLFFNWRLPAAERKRQLDGALADEPFWSREDVRAQQP